MNDHRLQDLSVYTRRNTIQVWLWKSKRLIDACMYMCIHTLTNFSSNWVAAFVNQLENLKYKLCSLNHTSLATKTAPLLETTVNWLCTNWAAVSCDKEIKFTKCFSWWFSPVKCFRFHAKSVIMCVTLHLLTHCFVVDRQETSTYTSPLENQVIGSPVTVCNYSHA